MNNQQTSNTTNNLDIWNYIAQETCDETRDVITDSIDEDIANSNETFEEIFRRKRECKKIKKLFGVATLAWTVS